MQETQVLSLGWENPLEEGMENHSSILAWEIPWTEVLAGYPPWGSKELDALCGIIIVRSARNVPFHGGNRIRGRILEFQRQDA